jgi:dipeptidase D
MARFFEDLAPERVWYHFEELTKLPHGSGNEDRVREYIVHCAQKLGYDYYYQPNALHDAPGERVICIYKKAAVGLEKKPIVVLQAHMDMVCVPSDQIFPLQLQHCDEEGNAGKGWVKAGGYTNNDGTTLGADDGIGVAIALAILEDSKHQFGPIECFFTVQEENGMDGVREFAKNLLKGRVYINLDEEEYKSIIYGGAGGLTSTFQAELKWESLVPGTQCYDLKISGLKGGHSGASIHEGRANAIQLLARILSRAYDEKTFFNLAAISGGNLSQSNVIPSGASASIVIRGEEDAAMFERLISEMSGALNEEYQKIEENIQVTWQKVGIPTKMIDLNGTKKIIDILMLIPHGVLKLESGRSEIVETSTNLAAVGITNSAVEIICMHRSSQESGLDWAGDIHKAIASCAGVTVVQNNRYPVWRHNVHSELLQKAKQVYAAQFKDDYQAIVVHAGLECAWVMEKYQKDLPMDCISIGPTVLEPHTKRERLNIKSVEAFYDCVLNLLHLYSE